MDTPFRSFPVGTDQPFVVLRRSADVKRASRAYVIAYLIYSHIYLGGL